MAARVAIIGAGFGGLAAARALRKVPVDVWLIDRHNYHTFQPLLYQVATAGLDPEEIAHAVRGIFHGQSRFTFRMATVCRVDWKQKAVILDSGDRIPFDFLIVAAGATNNYYGIEGVAEHALPLKQLSDALLLRGHLIRQFEYASAMPDYIDEGGLNVVIVGGGPTGVELAGAILELFQHVFRKDYPDFEVDRARVILVEATDRLLGAFHPSLGAYARRVLQRRGVEVILSKAITRATDTHVFLSDGSSIPTRTLIWAAGIRAHPLADTLGTPQTHGGRLVVEPDLRLPGHPYAFAIGDIAASKDAQGNLHPQMAPVALQGGHHVARQIQRLLNHQPTEPFVYRHRGSMATIGRHAAVAELPGPIRSKGFIAWSMWLFLHLIELIGFRNRLNVLVNWAWNYFTYDRSARLILDVFREKETLEAYCGPTS